MMRKETAEPTSGRAYVGLRRAWIRELTGRSVPTPAPAPLPPERLQFLCREAEDLFWNELAWEELTDEEVIHGGHMTEMVFTGFLAFVDGLVCECPPTQQHPDAVEAILEFLGARRAEMTAEIEAGADSRKLVWARAMTSHLIDLVLYRSMALSPEEREMLDAMR